MKRFAFVVMLAATALLFTGCEEEVRSYLPDSHWILHVDGTAEGHRLALTFAGDEMEVSDASWDTPPFSTGTWYYYIDGDGDLYMYDYYTDSDGATQETSYTLGCTMSDDGLTLTLVYDPWLGSTHTYVFDKR